MTDSWGRPEGEGQLGAVPFPGAAPVAQAVGGPVFADEDEQGAGAGAPGRGLPGPRRPEPGAEREPTPRAGATAVGGGRAQRRRGTAAGGERQLPGAVPALVLICLPLVGALAGQGSGALFWAGALLGAVPAALLCSSRGVWWVATGAPPVVLLMSLFGHLVASGSSRSTAALATHLVAWVAGAFPVMVLAAVGAALVGVGRFARGRLAARSSRG
ncbi:DUF6542 domain-containing protein [Streptacidiphilus sp. P02-A3a]|uniref:DUF6542 domain-containing protein n=1 Tax=Streptacidiphilus sp. P02-A3a TaxID=2704468 RepID=UPI0015FAC42F|nr:DUF6542 domain-containing protein [Streptacidiphilus sp. P02-A3a]QMU72482.1 hypothetical protein GXP74_33785 [Streptacidiphilus sp. P02-A3a]